MSATPTSPDGEISSRRAQMDAVLEKILPFARSADVLARRSVGKVRTLALAGFLAALWIAYACAQGFELRLTATVVVFVVFVLPSAVLWKLHGMLRSIVGLPQRIVDTSSRLYGKAVEYREQYEKRDPTVVKPKFRQLWGAGKSVLELKGLTDEAQEIASLAGGALVLANPIFAIVLGITSAVTLAIIAVAAIVGLAYLL